MAFVDTKVMDEDGSTKIQVYRNPTHTDQYLNRDSAIHWNTKGP